MLIWVHVQFKIHYIQIYKKEDKQQLIDNLEKWDCNLGDGNFDLIKCSSVYCKMDCKVLMVGYEVFRTWISNWTDLNVDNYKTFQSLTSSFMLKGG